MYCELNIDALIANPREFLGFEIKLISLKNAQIDVLIMVIIFIDQDVDDCEVKSHVSIIATKAAHISIQRIIDKQSLKLD